MAASGERFKGKPKTKIKLVDTQVGWSQRVGAYTTRRLGAASSHLHHCCSGSGNRKRAGSRAGSAVGANPRIALDDEMRLATNEAGRTKVADDTSSITCVQEVQDNFVGLVRYNKLQLFYAGTLIYSVMNIAFIFYSTLSNHHHHHQDGDKVATLLNGSQTNPLTWELLWEQQQRRAFPEEAPEAAEERDEDLLLSKLTSLYDLPKVRLHPSLARLQLATLLPMTLLLGLIAAITALKFGGTKLKPPPPPLPATNPSRTSSDNATTTATTTPKKLSLPGFLQATGLILGLLLLYLPLLLPVALSHLAVGGTVSSLPASLACHLPLGSVLALAYLQPQLLEGGPLSAKLICCCTLLPLFSLALTRLLLAHRQVSQAHFRFQEGEQLQQSGDQRHLSPELGPQQLRLDLAVLLVLTLPLALLLGLVKRRLWKRSLISDTFAGAAELIEAKVSLEHQRQQQETLLLSVLPAYVAEQVKRNMLKKTNTALVQPNISPDMEHATFAAVATPLSTLGTLVTSNPWQARGSPSAPSGGQEQGPEEQAARAGNARNRLHAGASSDLAPIGGHAHLARACSTQMVDCSSKSNHLTGGHLASSSNTSAVAPAQLQQQLGTGSQARRGFNELYIRTYNNVSLLYGDIVGFTRLCTQLSSSQLVRVLNDLFSHFDYLAEKHKIMRIKILGDCYYGVSGIPEFAVMGAKTRTSGRSDNHAINCVNMGLDMIHYIRCLNVERASSSDTMVHPPPQLGTADLPSEVKSPEGAVNAGHGTPLPQFELNMRIGIHTGHIHSGVIGLKKWQFDVWSNDVSIAMHSESSGIPGRVQVTDATLAQLNGAFSYENAPGCRSDPFLSANDIRTYLIRDRVRTNALLQHPQSTFDKEHTSKGRRNKGKEAGGSADELRDEDNIRAATIGTIRQTLLAADNGSSGGANSFSVAFNYHDLSPLMLTYRDSTIRKLHHNRPIEQLVSELARLALLLGLILPLVVWRLPGAGQPVAPLLAGCVLFLLLLSAYARVSLRRRKVTSSGGPGKNHLTSNLFSPFSDPLTTTKRVNSKWSRLRATLVKPFTFLQRLLAPLAPVKHRTALRSCATSLALVVVILLQALLVVWPACQTTGGSSTHGKLVTNQDSSLATTQQYQITVILLLLSIDSCVYLLSYKTKCCMITAVLGIHLVSLLQPAALLRRTFCHLSADVAEGGSEPSWVTAQQAVDWSSNLIILVLALCSLAFARQLDYNNKASFLWRNRLNVDHEELEYISGINKLLLENILPSHVVQHYLTHPSNQLKNQLPSLQNYMRMSFSNMRTVNNELYHEQHEHVAIMFASIPHFYEFYDESDISKQGLGCIALLNEIICDFDKLLLKNKFSRIEKIKTIGSTYMAAAGLRPCYLSASRGSSVSNQSNLLQPSATSVKASVQVNKRTGTSTRLSVARKSSSPMDTLGEERKLASSQQKLNLICMIQFASSLMTALNGINKQSFQVFKLRVGVNTGSVIAGVIGAQRPFYDIWGDSVNIASRMESLGEVGRIQVEERTARLLMDNLCSDTYSIVKRGPIDVKGKGGMLTYFVDKKKVFGDESLIATRQQMDGQQTVVAAKVNVLLSSVSCDEQSARRAQVVNGSADGCVSGALEQEPQR